MHAGTEFAAKVIKMDDNYQVKLQIWDTAGQETFRSIIKTFFRNSGAVLLVYKIVRYANPYAAARASRV